MSIEVNGVSLPDIPEDVLASYPYAAIIHTVIPTYEYDIYTIAFTTEPFYFFTAESKIDVLDGACDYWPHYLSEDGTSWYNEGDASVDESPAGELSDPDEYGNYVELFAANYDILTVDADGNATDTVYFAANFSTDDPNYYTPKSWYDGMARQVMRLTGTSDKLTKDKMLEDLKGVEVGGGSEPLFVSTATGTVTS